MRKVFGIVAALAAVSTVIVVGATSSAWACSCIVQTEQDQFERAEVVFTGTVVERDDSNSGQTMSSGDPVDYTVDVDATQKGSVGDPAVVRTARDDATCGFSFTVGRRYQIFAQRFEGHWTTNICSGTHDLGQGAIVTASPKPSVHRSPTVPPATVTPSPAVTASPSPTPAASSPTPFVLVGPPLVADPNRGKPAAGSVAGASAVAMLGALLWTLRGRRNA